MMEFDFTKPNRQSAGGVFIIYLKTLAKLIRATFVLFGYLAFKLHESIDSFWTYFILAIVLLLVIAFWFAYKDFKNFLFYVNEDEQTFVLEKGIFTKEKTIINFDKIVQINIVQPLLLQVLDLYKINIETSGSAVVEVSINALDEPVALKLQSYLQAVVYKAHHGAIIANDPAEVSTLHELAPIIATQTKNIKLSNGQILFAGLFTNYAKGIGVALLFLSFILTQFRDYAKVLGYDTNNLIFDYLSNGGVQDILFIVGFLLISPIVINLFRQVIRYFNLNYNYHLKDEIQFEYGLFELHKRIFKIRKLQLVKIQENIILQIKKLQFVTLKQIQTGPKDKSALLLPGLNSVQTKEMLSVLFKQKISLESFIKPNARKFIIQFLITFLFILILTIIGVINAATYKWHLIIAANVFLFLLGLFIYKRVQNERLYWDGCVLILKKGWLDKTYIYCPISSIQLVGKKQMLWQKRSNLGSMHVQTGAGSMIISYYDFDTISKMHNALLYKIEVL